MTLEPEAVALAFVRALVAKDRAALAATLAEDVDFRGLTPSDEWRATTPGEVAEIVFGSWFEPQDHIREVLETQSTKVADRHHVRYRFRVESDGETCLVEQHGYFDATEGLITRMSLVCSGFRPWGDGA
jgi:ketosteroid isomerase-like protein